MSKKRSIIIFSIITVLAVILILSSTIFRVRHQNVEFVQEIEGVSVEDVSLAGGVKDGKSVFLINKQTVKENIEKAIPYAKVENVYISFPNALNLVISKRNDFCFFEKEGLYYICDDEMKILRTSSEIPNLIEISANLSAQETGTFVQISQINAIFKTFKEKITIEIDGRQSGEITISNEKALASILKIEYNQNQNLIEFSFKENFKVRYDLNSIPVQKHYYLMGIIINENSSIITADERCDGKIFMLRTSASGGITKFIVEE